MNLLAAKLSESEAEIRVVVHDPPEQSPALEVQRVPIDEARGIYAIMAESNGRLDIHAFVFVKDKDWTAATVESWLTQQGFDNRRVGSDRSRIGTDGKADVREEGDFYVITGNVITRNGAFNHILRPADVLDKSWLLFEGVPVTHPHPPGLVEDLTHVAGFVRNARADHLPDGGIRILGDYWLARKPIAGLRINDRNVRLNEETVRRVRAGIPVDNSQGYSWVGRDRTKDDPANTDAGGDYRWVMDEQVPNHVAILLEEEGACNWRAGCGAARLAAQERLRADATTTLLRRAREAKPQGNRDALDVEEAPMACDDPAHKNLQNLDAQAQPLRQQLDHMKGGLVRVSTLLGLKADASCEDVEAAVRKSLDSLKEYSDAEQEGHKTLAAEVADLAVKLGEDRKKADAKYAAWPADALADHKVVLERLIGKPRGGNPGRFDSQADHGADAPARRTIGFPIRGADGKLTWTAKKGA